MSARPNLARRPFVDTRPANVAAAVLVLAVVVLTAIGARTVLAYLGGSRASREAIATLRVEIARLEASRKESQAKLARFDLAGMRAGAEEANALARLRSFSWSRFLTRLEKTLPNDVRVLSVQLSRPTESSGGPAPAATDAFRVTLTLVSRDPDGLPKLLRAFYGSAWFDAPTPVSESGGDTGSPEGRTLAVEVVYTDREAKP